MLISTHDTIKIIGYEESLMTREYYINILEENPINVQIISPEWFLQQPINHLLNYSYIISFTKDKKLRNRIIDFIDYYSLCLVTFIHKSSVGTFFEKTRSSWLTNVGPGTFIGPNNLILSNTKIGKHCIIEASCNISHDVFIDTNSIIHAVSSVGGRTNIGKNCELNMSCNVLPKITICDNVIIGAVSNVTKNITEPGFYAGYRARKTVSSNQINEQL